jgi:transcriptional regulator with XRE-family HTH domain
MVAKKPTGFDKYAGTAYRAAKSEIDEVDRLIRALDEAREQRGLTKAEVARAIGTSAAVVRRLFTAPGPNPGLATVTRIARVVGLRLEPVRVAGGRRAAVLSARVAKRK